MLVSGLSILKAKDGNECKQEEHSSRVTATLVMEIDMVETTHLMKSAGINGQI